MPDRPNQLYYGDNLDVLRRHIADESVDLIYLDPPFKSNQNYNVLFRERDGSRAAAQIRAFGDTWTWDQAAARSYEETVEAGGRVAQFMQASRTFLGDTDMLAYLAMMAPRLVELRRVLKSSGSIYLHCDPTASAHLRLLMDAAFGTQNFLNEVVWYYRGAGTPRKARARRHDVLLHYSKLAGEHYFNADPIRRPYAQATIERFSHHIGNVRGDRDYGQQQLNPAGKHPDDVITHIQPIAPSAKARLSYPTQKPEELLQEVIEASSNEGDIVLDPFCGCGTTVAAAHRLDRRWVGIDITHLAIGLIKSRLADAYGQEVADAYDVIGEPTTLEDATVLASEDPFQFQAWALGLVGARPAKTLKGADQGVDGRRFFHDEAGGKTKQVILSVKGGRRIGAAMVRDLRGVVERENAEVGALLTLTEPTQPMRTEAAAAGFYSPPWGDQTYPRLQILTIGELLSGALLDLPPYGENVTYRRAPRATTEQAAAVRLIPD